MVRSLGSIVLGTLFVTGCLFPSFDDMQKNDSQSEKKDDPSSELDNADITAKNATLDDAGAAPSTSAPNGNSVPAAPADASADVVTTSPGAGKIACNGKTCDVGPNSHCCAGYALASGPYCSSPSHTIGWCTGGGGRAVFCDEKADCPGAQVCCEKGDVTQCSDTCTGGKALP